MILLFLFIFNEIKKSIKNDIDKDGISSNKRYITYFSLFTLIPSILISIFSLFLFTFALEKYFDQKVTTLNNIEIDGLMDQKVNQTLSQFVSKDTLLQNRVYFKNLINEALKSYSG